MSSIPQIVLPCTGKEIIIKKSSREFRVFSIIEQKQLCTYLCKHMSYKNIGILICLYTVHIPQELRIRSRGTECHSASN